MGCEKRLANSPENYYIQTMMNFLKKLFGVLVTIVVMLAIIGMAGAAFLIYTYSKDLPDYGQLEQYEPPIVTRLYAADGRLLEEYAKERRLFVPISAIPKQVINSFLAAEDKNFYTHPGIDLYSLFRAMVQNVNNYSQNKSLVGGSTITQQVVKNFLLSNERSVSRKVKEAILSFRISQAYSKDRILELYLNQIYLGGGSYGVASAALNYFNKSMDELTIEEAAFLAILPKAPSSYDPRHNYDRAFKRRNWVIERMVENNFITAAEAKAAMAVPITLRERDEASVARADFFAESVRRQIAETYGSNVLYEGGLAVRTTLDPKLQKIAEKSFRAGLVAYDRRHGFKKPLGHLKNLDDWQNELAAVAAEKVPPALAPWKLAVVLEMNKQEAGLGFADGSKGTLPLEEMKWARTMVSKPSDVLRTGDLIAVEAVESKKPHQYGLRQIPEVSGGLVAMDPHTGKVLAMMGGYYYGASQFNRAMQAKRQPGSAFKPFVYLSALENGFTPSSIIVDGPIELSQGAGMPMWRPKNYSGDFLGPTTLRRGVEKSRNAMTVRLAQRLGIKKVMEVTTRFGINDHPARNFSMVLGASETTLINLTNAYAMIVNGGKRVTPTLIERIQDRNGKTIYKRDNRECSSCSVADESTDAPVLEDNRETVTDPRTAYQMVSILEGVVQRGTAVAAKKLGRTLGGKTGTTNESFDTWFIGFSPDLVVGTYIGFDNPRTLGKKETGASAALPIFISFMTDALKDVPDIPFRIPAGVKLVKIDTVSGAPAGAGTPANQVIYEAFKAGTEPTMQAPSYSEESPESDTETSSPAALPAAPAVPTVGTGGIY
jgi:penicillin-binding protein 1A